MAIATNPERRTKNYLKSKIMSESENELVQIFQMQGINRQIEEEKKESRGSNSMVIDDDCQQIINHEHERRGQISMMNQNQKRDFMRPNPTLGYIGLKKIELSDVSRLGLPPSVKKMLKGQNMVAHALRYDWQRIGSKVNKMDYYGIQLQVDKVIREVKSEMQTIHLEIDLNSKQFTSEKITKLAYSFSNPRCQFVDLPVDRFGHTFFNVHISNEVIFKLQPSKQWWDILVLCSDVDADRILNKIKKSIPVIDLGTVHNYPFSWFFIPSTQNNPVFPFTVNKFGIITYDCKANDNQAANTKHIDVSIIPYFTLSNEKYLSLNWRDHNLKTAISNFRQHHHMQSV